MPSAFRAFVIGLGLCAAPVAHAQTETSTVVEVVAAPIDEVTTPHRVERSLHDASEAPAPDAAAALRSVPGVSAGRFGGHGLEPVIRGQQQNRLNVVSDGTMYMGGCMNRMDPPTAYTALETYDAVVVDRGYQTVLEGAGGAGGTIRFERTAPDLRARGVHAVAGAGADSNGATMNLFGDVAAGRAGAFVRGYGSFKKAERYEDGGGDEVRSAFSDYNLGLSGEWAPASRWRVRAGAERREISDAEYAGAPMDAPLSRAHSGRLEVQHSRTQGVLRRLVAQASFSLVDHQMDNYSLRANPDGAPAVGDPPHRRVDADSTVLAGRLSAQLVTDVLPIDLVLTTNHTGRDATRFQGTSEASTTMVQSIMWPDVGITDVGAGAETTLHFGSATRLVLGGRYDLVFASHGRADEATALGPKRSPDDLYRRYYGYGASDQTEHNFGGLARLERDVTPWLVLSAKASRSVRTADATERGVAADGGAALAMNWVGDPEIAPELHHEVEVGAALTQADWHVNVAAYADFVRDFITRDNARAQSGVLADDGADVYRNVSARLMGVEADARVIVLRRLELVGSAAYTYGQNTSDDRPLPQIPAFEAQTTLQWRAERWLAGARGRFAAKQGRVDDDPLTGSGLDPGATDGYAVADLFASVSLWQKLRLDAGVTNIFDVEYAHHLSRSTLFNPSVVRVQEPGRSFYARIRGEI